MTNFVNTQKLDKDFNNLLHKRLFLQKKSEYRAAQLRKDVNMVASVVTNGVTLVAFYTVAGIIFQKIYDITGGSTIF